MRYQVPGVDVPQVEVFDASLKLLGQVARLESLTVEDRLYQASSAVLTLAAAQDPDVTEWLRTAGARVTVTYRDQQIFSGRVAVSELAAPSASPTLTVTAVGDLAMLGYLLAWPTPTAALTAQGASWTMTGPLETVAKALITANATRAGWALTVEPTQGRGPATTITARLQPVTDYLNALLQGSKVGLRITQTATGRRLSYVDGALFAGDLTEEGGQVLSEWTVTETHPTVSAVIVGNRDEGTARTFARRTSTASKAVLGYEAESFIDGGDADTTAELNARGDAALVEAGPVISASVPLSETEGFHCYGVDGVTVGSKVRLNLAGREWVDVITSIRTTYGADSGLLVQPIAGGLDGQSVTARRTDRIQRAIRSLQTR